MLNKCKLVELELLEANIPVMCCCCCFFFLQVDTTENAFESSIGAVVEK